MKKRILALTMSILLSFLALGGRLFTFTMTPQEASKQKSTRTREIHSTRGIIYDRSLNPLTNSTYKEVALILPTQSSLEEMMKKEDKGTIENAIKGYLTFKECEANEKYTSSDDIKILKKFDRYGNSLATHIIGYTDSTGKGVYGIEKYFDKRLSDTGGRLSVTFSADALGRILVNEDVIIHDDGYYTKDGLALTIDADIQKFLEDALKNNNIIAGAGVVLDVQTNEILGCASFPVFDRSNMEQSLTQANSPFLNRAFSQFPVGSVFKVVTAAAALEKGFIPEAFNCSGSITFNENKFNCSKLSGHGHIDFSEAMAMSCNPYFIQLGVETGKDELLGLCNKLHLGEASDFGNGYMTDKGTIPSAEELVCDADVGNLSFGQGRLTATPLQIACIFSVIANKGAYIKPTLIRGNVDENGKIIETKRKDKESALSENTCNILADALQETTITGTGAAAHSNLYTCCTKTATAQSGQFDEFGNEIKFCWFVGYFPKENPQYTICIMKENGSSGGSDCGPAFKEIAENILFR
jgi:penicillin-binding protein 2